VKKAILKIWPIILVAILTALCYAQKLDNNFVWDDHMFVLRATEHNSPSNIPGFFLTDQHRLYRPLRSVAYSSIRAGFGLSSVAHHGYGLFVHVMICAIFAGIILVFTKNPFAALFAGLVAGLHPLHCDRAVPVTASFDLTGICLSYAALLLFVINLKKQSLGLLVLITGLLAAGLLASEESATVPLLMLLFAMAINKNMDQWVKSIPALAIAFAVLVIYLFVRAQFVPGFARVEQGQIQGIFQTLMTMSVLFFKYIKLSFIPVGLSPDHASAVYKSLTLLPGLAITGLALLAVSAFGLIRKCPIYFVAVGWFFIGLAPFSNIAPLGTLFAERYFYAGFFGFATIAGAGFAWLVGQKGLLKKFSAWVIIILIFGTWFALTTNRINAWSADETLWTDAISKQPNSYMANLSYGNVLNNRGETENAQRYFQKAIEINPKGFEAYVAIGNHHMNIGRSEIAQKFYTMSLESRPGHIPAREGIIQARIAQGELKESLALSMELLKENPDNLVSLNAVGYILARAKRCDLAMPYLERLIKMAPQGQFADAARKNLEFCENADKPEM